MTVDSPARKRGATARRNFAYFHADTRPKLGGRPGSIFGFWPWGGGHVTPPTDKEISVMAAAARRPDGQLPVAARHPGPREERFIGESAFTGGIMYNRLP
jgi:hypothetical protein